MSFSFLLNGRDCPPLRSSMLRKSWQSQPSVLEGAFTLPLLHLGEQPVPRRSRTAETHRSWKSVVFEGTPKPHVADAAEAHVHLTGGQVARVVRYADTMRED